MACLALRQDTPFRRSATSHFSGHLSALDQLRFSPLLCSAIDLPNLDHTMDEARQRRPPSDAPSIPLEVLSGLGIDISSANMLSQEMDDHTTSHRKTTPESTQHIVSPPSTGGLSGSTQAGQSPANFFSPDANKPLSRHSTSYSATLAQQSSPEDPEASLLRKHHSASLYSAYGSTLR